MIKSYNARVHSITLLILLLLVSASSRAALIDEALRLNDTIRFELMSLSQQSELNRDICSINATASGLHAKQDSVLQQVVFSVIHFMVNSTHASQAQVCHRALKRWIQSKNTSIARHLFRQINTEEQLIALLTNNLSVLEIEDDPDLTNAERINRARQWRDGLILVLQNKSFFDLISEATVYLSDCHCFIKTAVDNLNRYKHQDTEAVHTIFRKYAQYVEKVSRVKEADGIQRIVNPDGSIAYKTTNITFKPGHPLYTYAQDAFYQKTELCAVETMEAQVISTGHLLQRVASAVLRFIIPSTHALSPEECLLLTSGEVDLRERFLDEQIITAAQSRVLLASFQSIFSIVVDESFTAANRIELAQAWLDALIRSLRENPDHRAAIIESAQAIWGFHTFINNQAIAITDRVRYNRDIIVGGNGLNARIHNRQILPDDDNSHLNRDRVRAIVAINHYYYQFVNQDRHISEGDFLQIVNANSNNNLEDLFDLLHNRWNQLRQLQDSYNTQLTAEDIVNIASHAGAAERIRVLIHYWTVFTEQQLISEHIVDMFSVDHSRENRTEGGILMRIIVALSNELPREDNRVLSDLFTDIAYILDQFFRVPRSPNGLTANDGIDIANDWADSLIQQLLVAEEERYHAIIDAAQIVWTFPYIANQLDNIDDLDINDTHAINDNIVSADSFRTVTNPVDPQLDNLSNHLHFYRRDYLAIAAINIHYRDYLRLFNNDHNRAIVGLNNIIQHNQNRYIYHMLSRIIELETLWTDFGFSIAQMVAIASHIGANQVLNTLLNNSNWNTLAEGRGLRVEQIVAIASHNGANQVLNTLLNDAHWDTLTQNRDLTVDNIFTIASHSGANQVFTNHILNLNNWRRLLVLADARGTHLTVGNIVAIASHGGANQVLNTLLNDAHWDTLTQNRDLRLEQIVAIASHEGANQVFTNHILNEGHWTRLLALDDTHGTHLTADDIVAIASHEGANQVLNTLLNDAHWDTLTQNRDLRLEQIVAIASHEGANQVFTNHILNEGHWTRLLALDDTHGTHLTADDIVAIASHNGANQVLNTLLNGAHWDTLTQNRDLRLEQIVAIASHGGANLVFTNHILNEDHWRRLIALDDTHGTHLTADDIVAIASHEGANQVFTNHILNEDHWRRLIALDDTHGTHLTADNIVAIASHNGANQVFTNHILNEGHWTRLLALDDTHGTHLTADDIVAIASHNGANQVLNTLLNGAHWDTLTQNRDLRLEQIVAIASHPGANQAFTNHILNEDHWRRLIALDDAYGTHLTADDIVAIASHEGANQTLATLITQWPTLKSLSDQTGNSLTVANIVSVSSYTGANQSITRMIELWSDLITLEYTPRPSTVTETIVQMFSEATNYTIISAILSNRNHLNFFADRGLTFDQYLSLFSINGVLEYLRLNDHWQRLIAHTKINRNVTTLYEMALEGIEGLERLLNL